MDFSNLNLQELAKTSGEWLRGSGPESDIVISSRIRLARNLADFPFISRATDTDRAEWLASLHILCGLAVLVLTAARIAARVVFPRPAPLDSSRQQLDHFEGEHLPGVVALGVEFKVWPPLPRMRSKSPGLVLVLAPPSKKTPSPGPPLPGMASPLT